jgi:hypothetical protein
MKNGSPRNWMEDKWNKVASAGFVIIKQLDLTNYDREEWPTWYRPLRFAVHRTLRKISNTILLRAQRWQ